MEQIQATADSCRELEATMKASMNDNSLCSKSDRQDSILQRARDKVREIKKSLYSKMEKIDDSPTSFEEEELESEKGEFKNLDCALPLLIGMQTRKRALSVANKNLGEADTALESACSDVQEQNEPDYVENYLKMFREGTLPKFFDKK
jgi:hypothetical protein